MTTEDYLASVKAWLATSDRVSEFRIVEEWQQSFEGYIRVRMTLTNGDFLEGAEYFVVSQGKHITKRYSYQWMLGQCAALPRSTQLPPPYPLGGWAGNRGRRDELYGAFGFIGKGDDIVNHGFGGAVPL